MVLNVQSGSLPHIYVLMGAYFWGITLIYRDLYVLPWGQMSFWGKRNASNVSSYNNIKGEVKNNIEGEVKRRIRSRGKIGPEIPEQLLSIIMGSLLGACHAERRSYLTKPGWKRGNTRLTFQQESDNAEYLMWIWKNLAKYNFCPKRKPKLYIRILKKGKRHLSNSWNDFLKRLLKSCMYEFFRSSLLRRFS